MVTYPRCRIHTESLGFPDPLGIAEKTVAYSPKLLFTEKIDISEECERGDLSRADIVIISRPCARCQRWVNDCSICGLLTEAYEDDNDLRLPKDAKTLAKAAASIHGIGHADGEI